MSQQEQSVFIVLKNCRNPSQFSRKQIKKEEPKNKPLAVKTRSMLKNMHDQVEKNYDQQHSFQEDLDKVPSIFQHSYQNNENQGNAQETDNRVMISQTQIFDVLVQDMFEENR